MRVRRVLPAVAVVLAVSLPAREGASEEGKTVADAGGPIVLSTNEAFVREARGRHVDLEDPLGVFALVFARLADSVFVYPTENYYYFRFYSNGQEISGNLRLDAEDRDKGLLDFAYFAAANRPEKPSDLDRSQQYRQLGAAQGVTVVRRAPLAYDVSFRGRTVSFRLNDLSQAPVPASSLLPEEVFVERTCDDSGYQFVLLFDTKRNAFRFVLDETAKLPDVFEEPEPGLLVGRLSGFAFVSDAPRKRKVLVAVDADNMRRNNYWDGPFDQLADNFVPAALQGMMDKAYPYARGRVDRRGCFRNADGSRSVSRLALTPFQTYNSPAELRSILAAARSRNPDEADFLAALTHDYKQDVPASPTPAPAKKEERP